MVSVSVIATTTWTGACRGHSNNAVAAAILNRTVLVNVDLAAEHDEKKQNNRRWPSEEMVIWKQECEVSVLQSRVLVFTFGAFSRRKQAQLQHNSTDATQPRKGRKGGGRILSSAVPNKSP